MAEEPPLVFVTLQRGACRLLALDADALRLGLEPGMMLADARARLPALRAVPHDPDGEMRLLEHLADLCDRFTPMVAIDPPDALVLDVAGCAHLFGDEASLAREAGDFMRARGLRVRVARAATPEAALALARLGERRYEDEAEAVRHLPLLALRLDPDVALALRRAGFTNIGDLAGLPRAPLAARFGAAMVDALDRLLGHTDSRITPRRLPPTIHAERRFPEPIARVETVMAILADLLAEVCEMLRNRHQGGRAFAVRLYRSDGAMRDLVVETGQPVRDPVVVLRLFDERVATLADPLDPGFGFDLVRLAVPHAEAHDAEQGGLESDPVKASDLSALLDRLGVRAGPGRFRRLAPRETHVPERATRLAPASSPPRPWARPQPGEPPLRPISLLDPPERIDVIAQVPEGPPRQFRWRGAVHHIVRQEGPERIAPEWWRRPDGHAADPGLTRDYYRVEDTAGRRFWVFCHGLYGREAVSPLWYLHGLFA
ncbi:Y-family DNA polymerase [Sphingobium lignivorans]|uniref:DNA-directed DNA polymerase n=1 Tax=Sphingobium lignivorans TaxID=2735886 RepID=A0ABR6NA81_9SPHN|nr:DNA polymerase Y family protein [Sphingobium lignivorans]MBB5984164.1 protein ImuB [Sphingobium lignivorans]